MSKSVPVSPAFRNVKFRQKYSPIEIRDKLRSGFKDRLRDRRGSLFNKLRDLQSENEMRNVISTIIYEVSHAEYKFDPSEEEFSILKEIEKEIVDAELNWLIEEHRKGYMDDDQLTDLMQNNDVICPTCLINNLSIEQNGRQKMVICLKCGWKINSDKSLQDLSNDINAATEGHNAYCNETSAFALLTDGQDVHIYLVCQSCGEMRHVF